MKRGANGSVDVGVKPQAAYHVAQKRVEADRFGPPLFCYVTSRHVDENGSQTVAHRRARLTVLLPVLLILRITPAPE
jgi:hypothetical protein